MTTVKTAKEEATKAKTLTSAEISLKDILAGVNVYDWLLEELKNVLSDILGGNSETTLLKELAAGKPIIEVHIKEGRKGEKPKKFIKLKCFMGTMTLNNTSQTCTAIWSDKGSLYQGTYSLHVDPDPTKTTISYHVSSPPGTPAKSYEVINLYFNFDCDLRFDTQYTISAELGIVYKDSGVIRTIVFTTDKDQIVGLKKDK
jgi:hypothetical protein